jgi:type II secretory pathway component GspD/PulD (secretin)
MHRITAILVLTLCALTSLTFAQDKGASNPGMPVLDPRLQKLVTIDAEDAFLPSILAILATESGYNIVTGPGVNKEERLTVHLKDAPIEQAMNLVIRAAGLSYEIIGNSFLVAPAARLKDEVGKSSYVIDLKYSSAAEVKAMLQNFNADVQVDTSGNRLLAITSPKVISEIQRVISAVDKPSLQIMMEARLIEVAVEDEEALGIDWGKLSDVNMVFSEMGPDQFGAPTQMLNPARFKSMPDELPFYPVDGLIDAGYLSRQPSVFMVTLDWLLKNNKAEVLANSKVATMNNRKAMLKVVDVIPYILSAGGVGGQIQVQEKEVGIMLQIKPTVNSDGYITTEVTPELSSVFQLIGPDQNIPWIVKRTSTTTIRVKDGNSIIIAGLLGVNNKLTEHKFPFLGDLPLIGGLFRHSSHSTKKTDLIIQITPKIIDPDVPSIELPDYMKALEETYIPGTSAAVQTPTSEETK